MFWKFAKVYPDSSEDSETRQSHLCQCHRRTALDSIKRWHNVITRATVLNMALMKFAAWNESMWSPWWSLFGSLLLMYASESWEGRKISLTWCLYFNIYTMTSLPRASSQIKKFLQVNILHITNRQLMPVMKHSSVWYGTKVDLLHLAPVAKVEPQSPSPDWVSRSFSSFSILSSFWQADWTALNTRVEDAVGCNKNSIYFMTLCLYSHGDLIWCESYIYFSPYSNSHVWWCDIDRWKPDAHMVFFNLNRWKFPDMSWYVMKCALLTLQLNPNSYD